MIRVVSGLVVLLMGLLCFQNCSPSMQAGDSLNSVTSTPTSQYQSFTLSSSTFVTLVNGTSQIYVSGGTAPFKYAVTSGLGSINQTGLYSAPSVTGSAVVTVTDSTSAQASLLLQIGTSTTYSSPTTFFQVPIYRADNVTNGDHLMTLSLEEATYTLNYTYVSIPFYIYSNGANSPVAVYRCLSSIGSHFMSTNSACEGATVEALLGYLESTPVNQATSPVYRCVLSSNSMHLETLNSAECTNSGYTIEGVLGYTAPVVSN